MGRYIRINRFCLRYTVLMSRIRLYSYTVFHQQHDTTVAAFLSALQVYDDIQPKYAYTVFVELYSDSSR